MVGSRGQGQEASRREENVEQILQFVKSERHTSLLNSWYWTLKGQGHEITTG
jgi:hypothetical protein